MNPSSDLAEITEFVEDPGYLLYVKFRQTPSGSFLEIIKSTKSQRQTDDGRRPYNYSVLQMSKKSISEKGKLSLLFILMN